MENEPNSALFLLFSWLTPLDDDTDGGVKKSAECAVAAINDDAGDVLWC